MKHIPAILAILLLLAIPLSPCTAIEPSERAMLDGSALDPAAQPPASVPPMDGFVDYLKAAANPDKHGLRADGRFYPYSTPQGRRIGEKVLAEADDPWLRQFTVIRNDAIQSPREMAGAWRAANKQNLQASRTDGDSAVAYFFSRELRRKLNRPVGVLHASVGATPIQTWSPGGKFCRTMIEPLVPYAVRGAFWYQGEKNVQMFESKVYAELLTKHVAAWRAMWGQADFPFYSSAPAQFTRKYRSRATGSGSGSTPAAQA